jgi:hypothetical protein
MTRRLILLVLLAALCVGGCVLNSTSDRAWISEDKYEQASGVYNKTGSLALTEKGLSESPLWDQAEINQAIYRLKKAYHLE